jgi:hypothetical protein
VRIDARLLLPIRSTDEPYQAGSTVSATKEGIAGWSYVFLKPVLWLGGCSDGQVVDLDEVRRVDPHKKYWPLQSSLRVKFVSFLRPHLPWYARCYSVKIHYWWPLPKTPLRLCRNEIY